MLVVIALIGVLIGIYIKQYIVGFLFAAIVYLFHKNQKLTLRILKLEAKFNAPVPDLHSANEQVELAQKNSNSLSSQPAISDEAELQPPPILTAKLSQHETQEQISKSEADKKEISIQKVKKSPLLPAIIDNLLSSFLGPLSTLTEAFVKIYQHYRKQGKAPVFFLTLAGIITMVMGFGYLLQFSFNEYLPAWGKITLSYSFSFAVLIGAIILHKNKKNMQEFASSLIGLSLILFYLCSYFLGSYFHFISSFTSFILLAVITLSGYVLAKIFETKIVAFISLVGGVCAPALLTDVISSSPLLYLSYLILICASILPLSKMISWSLLVQVSFALTIAFSSFTLFNTSKIQLESLVMIFVINLIFYLLCAMIYFQWTHFKLKHTVHLAQLSTAIIFILAALAQVTSSEAQYGYVLVFNALIFCGLFLYLQFNKQFNNNEIIVFPVLVSGVLLGIGLLTLVSADLLVLTWGLEGLFLLYLGLYFGFHSVRKEAYIILSIALLGALTQVFLWIIAAIQPFPMGLNLPFDIGYFNLVSILAVSSAFSLLLKKYVIKLTTLENKMLNIIQQCNYGLMSLIFLSTIACIWSQGFWLFALVPLFYLLYIANKHQFIYLERFALLHWVLLIIPVILSSTYIGNFHFSEQFLAAKIARVEAFIALWAIAYFYRRYMTGSQLFQSIQKLDTAFFIILPLCFLPSVYRNANEFFPVALWASTIISLIVYVKTQRSSLWTFAKLLNYTACITSIFACYLFEFTSWHGYASVALLIGIVLNIFICYKAFKLTAHKTLLSEKSSKLAVTLMQLFKPALMYGAASVFIITYGLTAQVTLSLLFTSSYVLALICIPQFKAQLKSHFGLMSHISWGLIAIAQLGIWFSVLSRTMPNAIYLFSIYVLSTLLVIFLAYNKFSAFKIANRLNSMPKLNLLLCHASVSSLYLSLIYFYQQSFTGPLVTIILVIHSTSLLFHTLKKHYSWLMHYAIGYFSITTAKVVLVDISDLSVIHKVLAFMLIGSILLLAAYQFQKLKSRDTNA